MARPSTPKRKSRLRRALSNNDIAGATAGSSRRKRGKEEGQADKGRGKEEGRRLRAGKKPAVLPNVQVSSCALRLGPRADRSGTGSAEPTPLRPPHLTTANLLASSSSHLLLSGSSRRSRTFFPRPKGARLSSPGASSAARHCAAVAASPPPSSSLPVHHHVGASGGTRPALPAHHPPHLLDHGQVCRRHAAGDALSHVPRLPQVALEGVAVPPPPALHQRRVLERRVQRRRPPDPQAV